MIWIERLVTAALITVVVLLTVTSLPVLSGHHLEGQTLMAHMSFSGMMVFLLPVYAILGFRRLASAGASSRLRSVGFWGMLLTGFLTIATVFACMLPVPSTDQMHVLVAVHGYVGFAMVAAAVVFVLGALKKSV